MSTDKRARAWVDVSSSALRDNFLTIRESVSPGVQMLPMVKADGYGLGMSEVVSALGPLDPWGFGVAAVEEGIELRQLGVEKPILVCSPLPRGSYQDAVEANLTSSISNLEGLALLREASQAMGGGARFHLEVDTGMGRAGFDWRHVEAWAPGVAELLGPGLVWEGCFTHFHSADGADDGPITTQWGRLKETVEKLPLRPEEMLLHACNSPGALRRPDVAADMVRPGIFLYGGVAGDELPRPTPVASLRSRIVLIKDAEPGSTLGYGATYSAAGRERWASVAIGYGDGLPRHLGNRGEAVLRGRRVPIIGRVSMDATVLEVTGLPDAAVGDVVTFFGRSEGAEIPLEEVADHAETINYEILTGLTRRLPRIWTDDGGY
jgi:alanine racemase